MTLKTGLLAAAAFVGMSASAFALPITGSFTIVAASSPINAGVTADMASGLTMGSISSFSSTATGSVIGGLQACSANCGVFNSISSFTSFSSVNPLISLNNGLSFDLTSIAPVERDAATGTSLAKLVVYGTGTYHLAGYTDTAGTFTITTTGSTSFMTVAFGQSSISVPEPGSMAIIGASLAAVGMIRRRRRV